jgi:protein-disulfide isomerase/uncharacterized membrane protein
MLQQYEPNVKATIAFLKQLKVTVNNSTVNETLQSHPNWPSLLCISDSLTKWNIPNAAAKINPAEIDSLPTPFIAYTHKHQDRLVVVTEVTNNSVLFYAPTTGNTITQLKTDFIKEWDGIYIIAEPNEQSGENDYKKNKQKAFYKAALPLTFAALLTALTVIVFNNNLTFNNITITTAWLLLAIMFTGTIITLLLLWYEADRNNPLLQKVCTGIAKGNCEAILTGKAAQVFKGLSWSEAGFYYFAGGLLVLVISTLEKSIGVVSLLNLLALPYIIFSVYYQWRVAKQWCILCLAVQALLLCGGILIITQGLYNLIPAIQLNQLPIIAALYLLPVLLWLVIKPYIKKLQAAKQTQREYLRIKFNQQVFDTLLLKQKQITVPADGLGIAIGNPAAKNTIIKVCNPYCGPCAKAHPKIEKLLHELPGLKAQIIFTTPNNPEHPAFKPINHLLAVAEKGNETVTNKALDDWYLAENKNYEIFAAKYPMNGELQQQGEKIEAMELWSKKINIEFTPTIFINGYLLPDVYDVEDLEYFLLE